MGFIVAAMGIILAPIKFLTFEEINWLFKIRGPINAPPEVVLVAINQPDNPLGQIKEVNSWSRGLYARLIERLDRCGPSVIALDVAFQDPGSSEESAALATAIARTGKVVLIQPIMRDSIDGGQILRDHLVNPIAQLADVAKGLGPFPVPISAIRVNQFWAFKDVGGEVPTLPAVALQVHAFTAIDSLGELLRHAGFQVYGIPQRVAEIANAEDLLRFMQLLRAEFRKNPHMSVELFKILASSGNNSFFGSDKTLLTALVSLYGGEDSYYLNFYGPPLAIKTLSFNDILTNNNLRLDLKGKAVFVGALEISGPVQIDGFNTPMRQDDGTDLSGVEIAATAFANLLTGQMLQVKMPINISILILFGLLAGTLACSASGIRAIALTLAIGIIYLILGWFLFVSRNIWIPIFIPILFQLPGALFLGLFCRYRSARSERERLIPWVPAKIADVPDTGHAFCVCLLTDIRGSRALSSRLSAEEYNSLMESYYKRITPPVKRYGGRVWDFSGDGMMCLFAARRAEPTLQRHACLAALEILNEVELFNQQLSGDIQLPTGIGLHSGWLELGGKTLGDIGNTAASIEELNKRLHTKALVSQRVVEGFSEFPEKIFDSQIAGGNKNSLLFRRLGAFSLPGKSVPLSIFELLKFQNSRTDQNIKLCELYAAALAAFEKKHWMESAEMFKEIIAIFPDDWPSQYLLFCCHEYCGNPPQYGEPAIVTINGFSESPRLSKN